MRRFLVLGHTQRTQPPIPLNDAAGAGGRWDVLARCVTTALLVSHAARTDTEIILALRNEPTRTVRVRGATIRNLNPDERSTLALLSKALEATDVGEHESDPLPGISTSKKNVESVLAAASKEGPIVVLREDSTAALEDWTPPSETATFVLSDHQDPTPQELASILRHANGEVSLGPVSLQADQCITVLHNRLDRIQGRLNVAGARPGRI